MTENKYAATSWGAASAFVDLTVPSGQVCQVRQPGVENLIAAGVLENADTLMGLVNKKIEKAQGKRPQAKKTADPSSLLEQDPAQLAKVFGLIDRVVEYMVVQPPVIRPVVKTDDGDRPMMPEERSPEKIYTDSIDLGDRMFIFQYSVGGGSDLESFRQRFSEGMGKLAAQ